MSVSFRLVLCLLLSATAARAGPWLRAPGDGFRADAIELPTGQSAARSATQSYVSSYLEYGLTDRLTLGADIGTTPAGDTKVFIFARTGLWKGARTRVGGELAIGYQSTASAYGAAIRPGLAWGRNLRLLGRSGWVVAELSYAYLPAARHGIARTEATFGLDIAPRAKLMLQASAEQETGQDPYITITYGAAWKMTDTLHLTFGIVTSPGRDPKLKAGFWHHF